MFFLHLGAPEGSDVPSPLRCTGRIIVEKEHLILQVHLRGERTSYHSGAHKWRRNILSLVHRKDKIFLLHLGATEG
jgi:hypothetical protein